LGGYRLWRDEVRHLLAQKGDSFTRSVIRRSVLLEDEIIRTFTNFWHQILLYIILMPGSSTCTAVRPSADIPTETINDLLNAGRVRSRRLAGISLLWVKNDVNVTHGKVRTLTAVVTGELILNGYVTHLLGHQHSKNR